MVPDVAVTTATTRLFAANSRLEYEVFLLLVNEDDMNKFILLWVVKDAPNVVLKDSFFYS